MRVSDSSRVLFVHVPKNAGSSIDWTFDHEVPDARKVAEVNRHSPLARLREAEPDLAEYWSFGFVRNPWARMVSWFSMMQKIFAREAAGVPRVVDKLQRKPVGWDLFRPITKDFATFVLEGPQSVPRIGRPQIEWLETEAGDRVDFIGRVEDFHTDFAVVRERLGLPATQEIPSRNKSQHGHYSDYYTDETRQRVAEVYARDITEFGYSFESG